MKRATPLLLLVLLVAACRPAQDAPTDSTATTLQTMATFQMGDDAELRLLGDSNLTQLEMFYGGELQELIGTANTLYATNGEGHIVLDTVHLCGGSEQQYIVRTYDRSSTYGAKVWYIIYPYSPRMQGDGPWCIAKVPWDLPGLEDIDADGVKDLLMYQNPTDRSHYYCYAFEAGIFRVVPSLSNAR